MSALAHQTSLTTPIEEFFSAVLKDDVSRAEKALKKGAKLEGPNPETGRTALHMAAKYNSRNVLEVLIERGAKLDGVDGHGQTAVMLAAREGNAGALKMLLDAGGDLAVEDGEKKDALALAKGECAALLKAKKAACAKVGGGLPTTVTQAELRKYAKLLEAALGETSKKRKNKKKSPKPASAKSSSGFTSVGAPVACCGVVTVLLGGVVLGFKLGAWWHGVPETTITTVTTKG
jgi:hypothetical protein